MIYHRVNPPLVACGEGIAVIVTERQIRWAYTNAGESVRVIMVNHNINMVVCGDDFAIAAVSCGFYSWGDNNYGCLGTNASDLYCTATPEFVPTQRHLLTIACGPTHVMMVLLDEHVGGINPSRHNGGFRAGSTRLYGWGTISGLGIKYTAPRLEFEHEFYKVPHQLDTSEVGNVSAVSCGYRYSLVLAQGYVYLCCDDDFPGMGFRKLNYANVTRIFACCSNYVIWTKQDADKFTHRCIHLRRAGSCLTRYDDGRLMAEDSQRGSYWQRIRGVVSWPPARCGVEDALADIFAGGDTRLSDVIHVVGGTLSMLVVTTRSIYLVAAVDRVEWMCDW
jgi:hypothetical protein